MNGRAHASAPLLSGGDFRGANMGLGDAFGAPCRARAGVQGRKHWDEIPNPCRDAKSWICAG